MSKFKHGQAVIIRKTYDMPQAYGIEVGAMGQVDLEATKHYPRTAKALGVVPVNVPPYGQFWWKETDLEAVPSPSANYYRAKYLEEIYRDESECKQPWEITFEPAPPPFTKAVLAYGYDPYNTVDAHGHYYQTRWALMSKGQDYAV
jgi:hypothetical protein